MYRLAKWMGIGALLLVVMLLAYCHRDTTANKPVSPFLNLNDSVHYVGMNTCKGCHPDVYETYIKTGMGQSFDLATHQKSAAKYDAHALVYDTLNNYYYFPFWRNDSMFIREFRLSGKDTVHNREEYVSYVIGSGQHTNSHLVNFNGFVTQAPITFYTQKGQWDMAPGFEHGFSSRFSRLIGYECMTCHNGYPDFVNGSMNKYNAVPNGIDCERCHGAGSLHVQEKQAGHFVDTTKVADYTIVNPRRLDKNLQLSLCQRCHLQGVAVLNEGKHFNDFKPGMQLCYVMNVFLPRFENAENDFIMASQADRLRMSKCFNKTGMTCLTCHNPHVSVKFTPIEKFNTACTGCHNANGKETKLQCSETKDKRTAMDDNCSGCHMPKSGSIDIPHVNITDHYIRKHYEQSNHLSVAEVQKIKRFIKLQCLTKDNPTDVDMAKGYLHFYESYSSRPYYLDSAQYFLQRTPYADEKLNPLIHLYYLQNNYKEVVKVAEQGTINKVADDWALYRVGESYMQLGNPKAAIAWYSKATTISPYNTDFLNKKASALFGAGDKAAAQAVYEQIIKINPHVVEALTSLGFTYMTQNRTAEAADLLDKAIALDPDRQLALLNRAELYFYTKNYDKCRDLAFKVLDKEPENAQARNLIKQLAGKTTLF